MSIPRPEWRGRSGGGAHGDGTHPGHLTILGTVQALYMNPHVFGGRGYWLHQWFGLTAMASLSSFFGGTLAPMDSASMHDQTGGGGGGAWCPGCEVHCLHHLGCIPSPKSGQWAVKAVGQAQLEPNADNAT